MAEITVVYLSEDESIVERLIAILRSRWNVWWAKDIATGYWEEEVRREVGHCKALVPVLSQHAKGDRNLIIKDEMDYAKSLDKLIFPFLIGDADIPFGYRGLNHTKAFGWTGDPHHSACLQLIKKLTTLVPETKKPSIAGTNRAANLSIGSKTVRLPVFAFSLSSHETQVNPRDGIQLMASLQPDACLVSAYDYWKHYHNDRVFRNQVKEVRDSRSMIFLDSGNYEADRKTDRYSKLKNPNGWRREHFLDAAARLSADIVFSFDHVSRTGTWQDATKKIISDFEKDSRSLAKRDYELCPIVHLPRTRGITNPSDAPQMLAKVAHTLKPKIIAIPERELGQGLVERVRSVKAIRQQLNELGHYYPLHLLGTGNPLSMIALAAAGADSFDGLEWCRTVSEYGTGFLFHFQHLDLFSVSHFSRVKDPRIRAIVRDQKATYSARVACFNIDSFADWTKSMRDMIHAGNAEYLLKNIPNIGSEIFEIVKND